MDGLRRYVFTPLQQGGYLLEIYTHYYGVWRCTKYVRISHAENAELECT